MPTSIPMLRPMLVAKIHRATVTSADLHYVGSITVDADLLDAADLLPGQQVDVVDVTNGSRLTTYVIPGERGSGIICINGAAAHLVDPGDIVILIAYGMLADGIAHTYIPRVVFVDSAEPDRRGQRRARRGPARRGPRAQRHHDRRVPRAPPARRGAARRGTARRGAARRGARRRRPRRVGRRAAGGGGPRVTADPAGATAVPPRVPAVPATAPGVRVARRLSAPEPGWTVEADVVVVGSGVAGLTAALRLREQVDRVLLVTKSALESGSTLWAQGGIAAALDPDDTPEAHLADTLVAGVGLCDEAAVRVLVTEGPARVRELTALGARFDPTPRGEISLTREGGHHADRIVHAGGDATGAEISRALVAALEAVAADPGIEVIEHALVVDLLTAPGEDGRPDAVCGVTLHVIGQGTRDGVGAVLGRAVVVATGGIGQVFRSSTNPPQATGDGIAVALRAGAVVSDIEFVQFHPTVLWLGSGVRGQLILVSEAVRGEGALLLDIDGERFMPEVHPMAELAPRDVVSHAIVHRMAETGADHVFLDIRHLDAAFLRRRFPTIDARLREHGIDLTTDLMPVAPAQHFHSGGIVTDVHGRTSLPGLYAVGEVACTGVHGANRLASNSLLEGLVFAPRAADDIAARIAAGDLPRRRPVPRAGEVALVAAPARHRIQQLASDGPGVIRSATRLASTARRGSPPSRRMRTAPPPCSPAPRSPSGRPPTCTRSPRCSPRSPRRARSPGAGTSARTSPAPTTPGGSTSTPPSMREAPSTCERGPYEPHDPAQRRPPAGSGPGVGRGHRAHRAGRGPRSGAGARRHHPGHDLARRRRDCPPRRPRRRCARRASRGSRGAGAGGRHGSGWACPRRRPAPSTANR